MFGELKDRLKSGEIHKLSHRDYMKVSPASLGLEGKPRIAFLVGQGDITRGGSGDDGYGDSGIGAEGFNKLLRRAPNDGTLRRAITRTHSPPSDTTASAD